MLFILNLSLMTLNTAIFSILICFFACLKFIFIRSSMQNQLSAICDKLLWGWASVNYGILRITTRTKITIKGELNFKKESWYLLIANHQSWADILLIYSIFRNHIPMAKFFLKQQLLYVPFLGMACWALNMPFMKRYSRQYLLKYPEKRGEDLKATRESCEKFKTIPTTVVNFVEGTRYSKQKQQSKPTFAYLLPPKTGGIAYALSVMGEQFETVIDLTLAYPENRDAPFKDLLSNKMKEVIICVDSIAMDSSLQGDYFNDKTFKKDFQNWMTHRWQLKDKWLSEIYNKPKVEEKIPKPV